LSIGCYFTNLNDFLRHVNLKPYQPLDKSVFVFSRFERKRMKRIWIVCYYVFVRADASSKKIIDGFN